MRNKWLWIVVLVLILGGLSGVLFNRFVIPWLAGMPGLSGLHKLESSNPVVINRREEVQLNEGVDYSNLSRQAAAYTVSLYSPGQNSEKFLGNGIIASQDGMVLVSKSSIANLNTLTVVTNDGTSHPGVVRALDPKSELAIVTISANNLPFAQFADAFDMQAGQRVIYIGRSNKEFTHGFGLGTQLESISNQASLERVFYSETFENTISTDAKINSDFIGGPIINLSGRVVGMTSANLGVLIGEDLSTAVSSYFASGKIQRPAFGIKYLNLSASLAKLKGEDQGGMLVLAVDEGSPARAAGVVPGDLVISINNQPLPQSNFEKILNQQSSGDLPITVLRNGSGVNLIVKLHPK